MKRIKHRAKRRLKHLTPDQRFRKREWLDFERAVEMRRQRAQQRREAQGDAP